MMPGMAIKVIFLDFDGVIVTIYDRFHSGDPSCIAALNYLTDRTGAKIVVSSMWRLGRSNDELRQLLKKWGATGEFLDKTPRDWDKERGDEIQEWLNHHPEVEKFVILDDDRDMVHLMPRLVHTSFKFGMNLTDAVIAAEMLENK